MVDIWKTFFDFGFFLTFEWDLIIGLVIFVLVVFYFWYRKTKWTEE